MANDIARDQSLLLDMLLAAGDAREFISGMDVAAFCRSRLHQYAVVRALEVIGEAANNVSSGFQASHPELPWRQIIGMRHRLIHGYDEIDWDIVWTVANTELGPLITMLQPLIPPDDSA